MPDSTQHTPPHYRRLLIALSIGAILLTSALMILPSVVHQGLTQWIKEHGGEQVSVENVDFNPFTARLHLQNLKVNNQAVDTLILPSLDLQLDWWPLWKKQLVITGLQLSGVKLELRQEEREKQPLIGGMRLRAPSGAEQSTPSPWRIRLDQISLKDTTLHYQAPTLSSQLSIASLTLSGLTNNPTDQTATLTLSGTIDQVPVTLDGEIRAFSDTPLFKGKIGIKALPLAPYAPLAAPYLGRLEGNLTATGTLSLRQHPKQGIEITHDGTLSLAHYQLSDPKQQLIGDRLDWKGTLSLATKNQSLEGTLTTGELQYRNDTQDTAYQHTAAEWQGRLTRQPTADHYRLNVDGSGLLRNLEISRSTSRITAQQVDLTLNQTILDTVPEHQRATPEGQPDLKKNRQQGIIQPNGDLAIKGFQAVTGENGLQLLTIDSLHATQIASDETGLVTAERMVAKGLTAGAQPFNGGQNQPAPLSLAELHINQSSYAQDRGLRIHQIQSIGLQQQLIRYPDKSWNIDHLISGIKQLTQAGSATSNNEATTPTLLIERLTLTGNSRLVFQDQTTDPVYHIRFRPQQFSLENLDNRPPLNPTTIRLKGILDESSTLNLAGSVGVFSPKPSFQLKGRIEGLELPPLSAYTIPLMGYRLQSGKANSDIRLSAKAGKLEGESKLTLNQLEVEPLNAEKMAALEKQLDIPLETALDMLKDRNNQIRLDLPINGDLDHIQIDPSDAINQAIGRAMKKGAKTYLAAALFPFGTLLTLVELAGDAVAKVRLDPILFEPGSSLLRPNQHAYLEKVAQLLDARPEIHIRLCGVVVAADRQAQQPPAEQQRPNGSQPPSEKTHPEEDAKAVGIASDEALTQLAIARATEVERYLTKRHNIKGDRLISCQPRIQGEDEKTPPRLDLLI